MKLTTVLLIATIMQVSASGFSQRLTLKENGITIKQVFKEIKKQTGFNVLYRAGLINDAKKINADFSNTELNIVLSQSLDGQNLDFSIYGNTVVIKLKESPPATNKPAESVKAIEIYGYVLDEDKKPKSLVSVKLKGDTKNTYVTDKDGRFAITVPDDKAILVFSYVGYLTKELPAKNGMVVLLEPDLNKLNEMVVVGYGTTRRKDLTGSVASVNVNEVKDVPFATIDQALTGKAAGVQVIQSDGSPGGVARIRIRGGSSLRGGNDPLYIIDGVPMQVENRYLQSAAEAVSPIEARGDDAAGTTISGAFARGLNSLGNLNINDIESIDILKDASATAIYGSRAANGVVIITTKKGRYNQKPVFEANYYVGVSTSINEKVLDADQYIMIMKEAAANLNAVRAAKVPALPPDGVATKILNDPSFLGTANTDWLSLVTRNGITQNADISVRGGGSGSRYYTSLSYNKNNGAVLGTDYSRIGGKVSLDNEITSRFRINTNLDYGYTTNNITNGLYGQALFAPPTFEPYNPDGSVKIISPASIGTYAYEGFQNPLALLKGINRSTTFALIGSLAAEYDILKDLKFRSSVAVNYADTRQTNYAPSTVQILVPGTSSAGSSNNGTATQGTSQSASFFYENTITWDKQFNEQNRLNLLAGTSWQISKSNSFSASGQGFPDDVYLNNLSSAAVTLPGTGLSGQSALLSFYMRANYSLFDKYLFTFTGRSDASSKFSRDNRVGYFPSGGVAWRISQENFLKGVKWIDEIKIRASAGYTGTQNIADNLFYTLYSPVSYAGLNGLIPSQLGNDKIKWESTLQKDLGIDFSFFNSRLSGGLGYYEKSTSGLLFNTAVTQTSGFRQVMTNIADFRNRGLELNISGDFIRSKNFKWSGNFNISGNRSKVIALSNLLLDPSQIESLAVGNAILQVGQPIGALYGRHFTGILKTQAEVDAYRKASFYGQLGQYPYLGIGDASYQVDPAILGFFKSDIIGYAEPKFYGGYTNTFTYKNLSLTTLATFSSGGDILYLVDARNADVSNYTNKGVGVLKRWTPENQSSTMPRLILGQQSFAGTADNNVYDASFIKLKSVTLNYRFPKKLMDRLKLTTASVYVSATNLFTITHYPGADPEVNNDPYGMIGGYTDSGGYPVVRQFSLGLRVGF